MILYVSGTTRAIPPCILLEEAEADYEIINIDLRRSDRPRELLQISPYGRVPVLKDGQVAIDQSLAILIYLGDKFGRFLPREEPARSETLRLLMLAGTDIMFGHSSIFRLLRRGDGSYDQLINDYRQRLLGDLALCDRLLTTRDYLAGEISIADLMLYTIVGQYADEAIKRHGFLNLHRWIYQLRKRASVRAAQAKCPYSYDVAATLGEAPLVPKAALEGFRPVER